jgi:hypothetical protein
MYNSESMPELTHCSFVGNHADGSADEEGQAYGGGMYNASSSPFLLGCTFTENGVSAPFDACGGALYNDDASTPWLFNCAIVRNAAGSDAGLGRGGGICGGALHLTNSILNGNWADLQGGGIHGGSPTVVNSISWGNHPEEIWGGTPTVTYSNIQGGYEGEGNIDQDPLWVDAEGGDYHLGIGSPCIDAGTNDAMLLPEYDFEGDPRVLDGDGDGLAVVDMGIDESVLRYIHHLPLVLLDGP